jgi:hypothetical protein
MWRGLERLFSRRSRKRAQMLLTRAVSALRGLWSRPCRGNEPHCVFAEGRVPIVKEGDKYRAAAQRLREQANAQSDRTIGEQMAKVAQRYEELAQQVEAASRRDD